MAVHHKPLDQQVMVLTGASSGIGLCTAILAAERGAKLVLVARSEDTLQSLVSQIESNGGEAIYVVADVADREQMLHVAQAAVDQYGRIDTWVNDAGVSSYSRLDKISEADSRRIFDTNFWGVVNGSLIALPYLRKQGGALINLGSEVSEEVVPLQGMYSASKHAVKGFTDALRIEIELLDKSPVSITLIQPTAVNTPFPHNAKNYMDADWDRASSSAKIWSPPIATCWPIPAASASPNAAFITSRWRSKPTGNMISACCALKTCR